MGIEAILIGSALAGIATSVYQGQKQASQMKGAQAAAQDAANKQAAAMEQDMNKRNAKQPNIAALLAANLASAKQGATSLSGPQGVDTSTLPLSRNTLIGS